RRSRSRRRRSRWRASRSRATSASPSPIGASPATRRAGRTSPGPGWSRRGMLACLVSLTASAAVDVEHIVHTDDLAHVAEAVLARREREALGRLAGSDWTERFFDYWTLKEAYAKARGEGLGLPFGDIGF